MGSQFKSLTAASLALLLLTATPVNAGLSTKNEIPEFLNIAAWVNTEPLTKKKLEGKTKLIIFASLNAPAAQALIKTWNAWRGLYKDSGFELILIATADYAFEKNNEYVKSRVERLGIKFPVARDSDDRSLWRAYNNLEDLTCYFADGRNRIRQKGPCTAQLPEKELTLREFLKETVNLDNINPLSETDYPENIINPLNSMPLGYTHNTFLGNSAPLKADSVQTFKLPDYRTPGKYYLEGQWIAHTDRIQTGPSNGNKLRFKLKGPELYVLAQSVGAQEGRMDIYLDEKKIPKPCLGKDITAEGDEFFLKVQEPHLYQILKDCKKHQDAEITFSIYGTPIEIYKLDL